MKLKSNPLEFCVRGTYVSVHPPPYRGIDRMVTRPEERISLTLAGIQDDRHYGIVEDSDNRNRHLYGLPGSVQIRNNRQWSLISKGELERLRTSLELKEELTPELLGINIFVDGDLGNLPPLSYLIFSSNETCSPNQLNVVLVRYGFALPCVIQGSALDYLLGNGKNIHTKFPKAAIGNRGSVGWVEKGGVIKPGDYGWAFKPTGNS